MTGGLRVPKDRLIIGITGHKRSGKDTAAEVLVAHGYNRFAFADRMKKAAAVLLDLPDDYFFDDSLKEDIIDWLGATARDVLQTLGTDWGRNIINSDIWVKVGLRDIEKIDGDVVVSDVRFDNEAQAIHGAGGLVVKIERPGAEGDGHESEAGISDDLVDIVLKNDGTKGDLQRKVRDQLCNES